MTRPRLTILFAVAGLAVALALAPARARAQAEGSPEWHLEQPQPPPPPAGVPSEGKLPPIGLGKVGDIQFLAPNRGLLITAGNPPTIPAGVWWYNGSSWRELSTVCGGTDGRVAWAGSDEFWTVSDGRPGQAGEVPGKQVPLQDDTLCHFAAPSGRLEVVASYATLAFQPTSYQAMHAAGCISPSDCWFAGGLLPAGQRGAFQLHWEGSSLVAEPNPNGRAAQDLVGFEGRLYESVQLAPTDLVTPEEEERFFAGEPSLLHIINPIGVQPAFVYPRIGVPHYAPEELPEALGFFHLSAGENTLWGAASPPNPAKPEPGAEVTVIRDVEGIWTQLLGNGTDPEGKNPFTKFDASEIAEEPQRGQANETAQAIAAEPGGEDAWLALNSLSNSALGSLGRAMVARISSVGTVSERQTLPTSSETAAGVGPKGSGALVACPAANDCWLVTSQGWLFHREQGSYPELTDPAYPELGQPITFRPPDQGLPAIVPDAPPPDDSGERPPSNEQPVARTSSKALARQTLPLLSDLHSRLVRGTTLELRFHLAVKARIRLLAKRHGTLVASTPTRTLAAGAHKLLLLLNPKRWPTKLALQSHPLAPLPTVSAAAGVSETVSTRVSVLPKGAALTGLVPQL